MLDITHNSPSFQIRENAPVFLFTLGYKTGVSQWPAKCVLILHDHWRNQNDHNAIFVKKELCSPSITDMTHISLTSSWVVNISESWILVRFIEMTEMVSAWVNHTLMKLESLHLYLPFVLSVHLSFTLASTSFSLASISFSLASISFTLRRIYFGIQDKSFLLFILDIHCETAIYVSLSYFVLIFLLECDI